VALLTEVCGRKRGALEEVGRMDPAMGEEPVQRHVVVADELEACGTASPPSHLYQQ